MNALSPIALQALQTARQRAPAKPGRCRWTPEEDALLRQHYPATPLPDLLRLLRKTASAIYQRARTLGLKRSAEYLASEHACRLRRGDNVGAASRFQKGHTAWNKGRKGQQAEGCQATQFRKGNKPHTWVPIGTEQIRDGYLWRKVTDNGSRHDWRQVHVMLWEQHHGPAPAGLILVFRDRDRTNIQLGNLELITRAENCRRNSIHRYPPELKEVIRLQKKLQRKLKERPDEKQVDRPA